MKYFSVSKWFLKADENDDRIIIMNLYISETIVYLPRFMLGNNGIICNWIQGKQHWICISQFIFLLIWLSLERFIKSNVIYKLMIIQTNLNNRRNERSYYNRK